MKRTEEELNVLKEKVIKHYFSYPALNGYDYMCERFGIDKSLIRKILSDELERRFNKKHRNV